MHVLGGQVLVTRLCPQGYGLLSADYTAERLLSVPFTAGICSGGWLTADHRVDPANPVHRRSASFAASWMVPLSMSR
ncbi:MAG: hypothetical protein ACOH1Y_05835 [Propionicimonas sp.]